MQWAWVAIGGALGSVLRFFLQGRVQAAFPGTFPMGTLGVNLIGSAVIGLLAGVFAAFPVQANVRLFLVVGVLGGFTTFSAFSMENVNLIREGHGRLALMYVLSSNGIGIGFAFAGYFLARWLSRFAAAP